MSMREKLMELEKEGRVHRFPSPKGFNAKRALFMSEELVKAINGANTAVGFYKCKPEVIRLFERWVKGDLIKIRMNGHGKGAFIALLDDPPPDVWELRVTEPKPQFRVFCRFVCEDMIVATSIRTRDELGPRQTKTGKKSQAWASAMRDCVSMWSGLFPAHEPHNGKVSSDFLTECENV